MLVGYVNGHLHHDGKQEESRHSPRAPFLKHRNVEQFDCSVFFVVSRP